MAKIIDSRTSLDNTVKIFDAFYSFDLTVNANEYDIVNGYFLTVCQSKQIADNFTVYLFRISQETKIPVLDLLQNLKGLDKMKMNNIIAYYLNTFKSKSSLYGTGVLLQPNQSVARNIIQ